MEKQKTKKQKGQIYLKIFTSTVVPSSKSCKIGLNSTMKSHTDKRQSISLFHKAFFSGFRGSILKFCPNTVAAEDHKDV